MAAMSPVALEDFACLKHLGSGGFGKVLLCRLKTNKQLCALKVLRKKAVRGESIPRIYAENQVLKLAYHPFLTKLLCSFQTRSMVCFALEYVPGGDLVYHLNDQNRFSEDASRFYGTEVLLAVSFLHSYDIIHRDIKSENVLIAKDGHAKLADFGVSVCKEQLVNGLTTGRFGTIEYMAPEVLNHHKYGKEVDWWSFGVLMFEMLHGYLPFDSEDPRELKQKIRREKPCYATDISSNAINLLRALLTKAPSIRLGARQGGAQAIKEHRFFEPVNWEDAYFKRIPPPFVPHLNSDIDTRYFDEECTTQSPDVTDSEESETEEERFFDISFKDLSLNDQQDDFEDSS